MLRSALDLEGTPEEHSSCSNSHFRLHCEGDWSSGRIGDVIEQPESTVTSAQSVYDCGYCDRFIIMWPVHCATCLDERVQSTRAQCPKRCSEESDFHV